MKGVRGAPILSNRMLPRPVQVAMCINQSYLSPSPAPVPMHRRVTHLGTSLRKRAGATESLIYRPRRTFSTTRVHHATHYDTLSIPRNASKSQIKVSTLPTQFRTLLVPHAAPSPPITRYGTHPMHAQFKTKTNSAPFYFYFAPSRLQWVGLSCDIHTVEQEVPPGCEQRASSQGKVPRVQ
jgi:hypothetical protein